MRLPPTYFPNPNPTNIGEELFPTIENKITVKLIELCFTDKFNTFGLRAPVERFITDDDKEVFKLDKLKLIYTRPKLDADGKEIIAVDPTTGEEFVVTEDVPYKHLVKGYMEIGFKIDQEKATFGSEVLSNTSKQLTLIGYNVDCSRINSNARPLGGGRVNHAKEFMQEFLRQKQVWRR